MTTLEQLQIMLNIHGEKHCLLAGAGISVCAGIPLATTDLPGLPSVVTHIKEDLYRALVGSRPSTLSQREEWFKSVKLLQPSPTIYSDALETVGQTPKLRQEYLAKFFKNKKPQSCHESIAALIGLNKLHTVFTTNFDPLIEQAIRNNEDCEDPKVTHHDEDVEDVLIEDPAPNVIKLHGDYLFSNIKNTGMETGELTKNMRIKLTQFCSQKGLIVIGYSGNDQSVMGLIENMVYDRSYFPYGLYWLYLKGHEPNERIRRILNNPNSRILEIQSAETLLTDLVHNIRVGDQK